MKSCRRSVAVSQAFKNEKVQSLALRPINEDIGFVLGSIFCCMEILLIAVSWVFFYLSTNQDLTEMFLRDSTRCYAVFVPRCICTVRHIYFTEVFFSATDNCFGIFCLDPICESCRRDNRGAVLWIMQVCTFYLSLSTIDC